MCQLSHDFNSIWPKVINNARLMKPYIKLKVKSPRKANSNKISDIFLLASSHY